MSEDTILAKLIEILEENIIAPFWESSFGETVAEIVSTVVEIVYLAVVLLLVAYILSLPREEDSCCKCCPK